MTRPKLGIVVKKRRGAPKYEPSMANQLVQEKENNTTRFEFADQERHQQFATKIFALVR